MDEKDLLIFLTLADTGNLTRTAEKLYLSQTTLSKRLQNCLLYTSPSPRDCS